MSKEDKEIVKVRKKKIKRPFFMRTRFYVCLTLALALFVYIWFELTDNSSFEETFYHVQSDKISDDMRVVLLSDLHNSEFGPENNMLVERIAALEPDMIVAAGDMVNEYDKDTSVAVNLCRQLLEIAPVYYGFGNHEGTLVYDEKVPLDGELSAIGVTVFYNDSRTVEVKGNVIDIGAVGTPPKMFDEYSAEFIEEYVKSDHFKLLIAHFPSLFYEKLADENIDLALCGHFHGGQVQIPGVGGLYSLDYGFFPKYCDGIFELQESTVIVSRGLGNSRKIPRINNKPELVIVDIGSY